MAPTTNSRTMDGFTLLMAVYAGDILAQVTAAYDSATTAQTLPPTYAVIVQDGPVDPAVAGWLVTVAKDPHVTVVALPHNVGLAPALNAGLAAVPTEIVARVDADDICLPQRFAIQIPLIQSGLDLVGAAIAEFDDDPARPGPVRSVRTTQSEIEKQARLESPFHHPSVVFRKSAVLRVGGYPELRRMEDVLLWARMLLDGARVGNVPDVLVLYRVGSGAFARRGGSDLARSEAQLQKAYRAMGFTTRGQYIRNRLLRGPLYRRLPGWIRRPAYHWWRRHQTERARRRRRL